MNQLVFEHAKTGKVSHVNGLQREYTLCGLAILESSINVEGFEWLRHAKDKKPDCADCIKIINYCKSIPAASLSKNIKQP